MTPTSVGCSSSPPLRQALVCFIRRPSCCNFFGKLRPAELLQIAKPTTSKNRSNFLRFGEKESIPGYRAHRFLAPGVKSCLCKRHRAGASSGQLQDDEHNTLYNFMIAFTSHPAMKVIVINKGTGHLTFLKTAALRLTATVKGSGKNTLLDAGINFYADNISSDSPLVDWPLAARF